eukprot:TRINITY_DN5915_c0_g1_i1.p1 TRINITY_DN5915_c0_g1~~TRINITY_DN5915_c0_g1_i1.p1  ORF type:complete len:188 (+),score=10.72 TRINITY_DN5915_c0_g1_i1:71-634(+)
MLVGGARANPSPPPAEAAEEKEVGQPPPGSELPAAPPITSPNAVLEKARPHDSRPHSPAHTTAAGSELVSSSSNNRRFSTLSGDSVSDPDTSWVSEDLGPPCVVCHSNSASDLLLKCELCDVAIHTFWYGVLRAAVGRHVMPFTCISNTTGIYRACTTTALRPHRSTPRQASTGDARSASTLPSRDE